MPRTEAAGVADAMIEADYIDDLISERLFEKSPRLLERVSI